MPPVLLGSDAYKRDATHGREVKVVNRFLERDPTNQVQGVSILPRPGLVPEGDEETGPVRGIYRKLGVLGGDWLIVRGTTLYRRTLGGVETTVGTIAGDDLVEIASDGTNTFIAAGTLYLYDGTTLTEVTTPDDVSIVSIAQIDLFFLLQVEDSGRVYWILPGETTIDPLDYMTAESSPDNGVAIRIVGDFIAFLNGQSLEIWTVTGAADLPFQRQPSLIFEKGCSARETAVNLDNALFWVSETAEEGRVVYRGGQTTPQRVSTNGIEERLKGRAALSAFGFIFDGHAFYALRIEGVGTFLYDVSTGGWCEWQSYLRANWRVQCAGQAPGGPLLLGDDETGQLWTLDAAVGNDDGQPIIRTVTGGIPLVGRFLTLESLHLEASVGWSPTLDLEPLIGLRLAKDGFTWGNQRTKSLGRRGQYGKRVRWERLGEIRPPGVLIELTDSDDAQTTISYCRFNEAA